MTMDYPVIIQKLSDADGGGFLALFPDLPGCVADGETPEEAIVNAQDALGEWIETNVRLGRELPEPNSAFKRGAKQRKDALDAVRALSIAFNEIDDRLETVESELADLKEEAENMVSWIRFAEITASPAEAPRLPAPERRGLC